MSRGVGGEQARKELNRRLASAPILAYPDPKKTLKLDANSSGVGIGAWLSREQVGMERVIAYGSQTLPKGER